MRTMRQARRGAKRRPAPFAGGAAENAARPRPQPAAAQLGGLPGGDNLRAPQAFVFCGKWRRSRPRPPPATARASSPPQFYRAVSPWPGSWRPQAVWGGSAVLAAERSFSSLCGSPLHPSPPWYGFSAPPLFCGVGSRNARLGPLCFTKNDGVTARFHHLRQRVSSLFRGAGDCGLSVGAAATRGNSLFKTSCLARPLSGTDLSRSFFPAGGGRRERAPLALRFTAKSGVSACGRRPFEKPNCRCVLFFSFWGECAAGQK